MTRDTVGKISLDLSQKAPETRSPIEQMRENLTEYEKNVRERVDDGILKYSGDFYVEVLIKRERLLSNVYRHYFIHKIMCPMPNYDQVVYKYKRSSDDLVLAWIIPDRETCMIFLENKNIIVPEERELLQFVLAFEDGTLYRLAKDLNGEKIGSIELENK